MVVIIFPSHREKKFHVRFFAFIKAPRELLFLYNVTSSKSSRKAVRKINMTEQYSMQFKTFSAPASYVNKLLKELYLTSLHCHLFLNPIWSRLS